MTKPKPKDNVDNTFKSPLTTISIGPGIRGIERGVERVARLVHLAYVEIEAYIVENLVAQMERRLLAPAVIWSDAKTLPCEPFRGLVDLLLAGYPCQPFSIAGKRRGIEDPRHLFPYIERAIRIIQPRACFFENVRGHVTCGLPEVIAAFEGLGYRVHWGIYSAEETGAAHKRERVFILAILADTKSHNWGLQLYQRGSKQTISESIRTGEELENSTGIGCRSLGAESEGFQRGTITDHAGNELADTNSNESERDGRSGGMGSTQGQDKGEEDQRERLWDAARAGSETVANNNNKGLQELKKRSESEEQPTAGRSRGVVSRPGKPQQAWEHPRVISREVESAVGLSANGYHFREDVLRALGNSVYEDTAELAFRDLLRKHGLLS